MHCSCATAWYRDWNTPSCNRYAELRRWLLTFVVIGGGFSGVEVAGEIVDFLRASIRFLPQHPYMEDIKVVLVARHRPGCCPN
jgi:NADH dehydrogenase FAD-containing subunit